MGMYNLQALLSISGLSRCNPRHASTELCLLVGCKSVEKSRTPSDQTVTAFLRDCARDDLFSQDETMLENDSPRTSLQFCVNAKKKKHTA